MPRGCPEEVGPVQSEGNSLGVNVTQQAPAMLRSAGGLIALRRFVGALDGDVRASPGAWWRSPSWECSTRIDRSVPTLGLHPMYADWAGPAQDGMSKDQSRLWVRCPGCSARLAGKPWRRVPVAVRAPRRELPGFAAEDPGQSLDLVRGEAALPAVAVTFGGAYDRAALPTHERAEFGLGPSVALAQDTDVGPNDLGLRPGDLPGAVAASGHHAIACQVTR